MCSSDCTSQSSQLASPVSTSGHLLSPTRWATTPFWPGRPLHNFQDRGVLRAVVPLPPHKESSLLLRSHRTAFPKMFGSCRCLGSFRFIACDWKHLSAQCSSRQEHQKWSICKGLKGHTCTKSPSCFLGKSAQAQKPWHAQEAVWASSWWRTWSHCIHRLHWTRSGSYGSYQLLQGDLLLLFWASQCSSAAVRKE